VFHGKGSRGAWPAVQHFSTHPQQREPTSIDEPTTRAWRQVRRGDPGGRVQVSAEQEEVSVMRGFDW
jgi:hypothetical protein